MDTIEAIKKVLPGGPAPQQFPIINHIDWFLPQSEVGGAQRASGPRKAPPRCCIGVSP
ncbi:hypothetical protein AAKU55_004539 [Oxalobacteraceae bacterium GrIS 1.11]